VSAKNLTASNALFPILAAVVIWGSTAWGFYPAQQARLIGVAGLSNSAIVLSLNASLMYFGFSLGAVLGSLILLRSGVTSIGWVGGIFVLAALALFVATHRGSRRNAEGHLARRS
jgi:predicted MFS family arabinose efflux permease